MRRFLAAVVVMSAIVASQASAQDTAPTPAGQQMYGDITARLGLPSAADFGPDWRLDLARRIEPVARLDAERYQAWYTRADGSRIYLIVDLYGTSISDAVALSNESDDLIRQMESSLPEGSGGRSAIELGQIISAPGCSSTTRAEGEEPYTRYPVGALSCLDEENQRVLTVVVSGSVQNARLQNVDLIDAAHFVLRLILDGPSVRGITTNASPVATPVA